MGHRRRKNHHPHFYWSSSTKDDRGQIPCYWENRWKGCTKRTCAFKHFKPRPADAILPQSETQSLLPMGKKPAVEVLTLEEILRQKALRSMMRAQAARKCSSDEAGSDSLKILTLDEILQRKALKKTAVPAEQRENLSMLATPKAEAPTTDPLDVAEATKDTDSVSMVATSRDEVPATDELDVDILLRSIDDLLD